MVLVDTGDDQNHDAGKRIEKEAPVGDEANRVAAGRLHRAGRQPFEHDLLGDAVLGIRSKQLKRGTRRVNKRQTDAPDAKHADASVREALAEKKHQRCRRQREQRNHPEMIEKVARGRHAVFISAFISSRYHFSKSISSSKTVSRLRKNAMMIPSATAASAAASAMMNSAKTCPATSPYRREKATRLMFTAFKISSMDMSTTMTLRRVTTPITPMIKSARLRNK